jgi:hypothetical protein
MIRPLVLIESPYSHPHPAGIKLHQSYLELCLLDSIHRGECPIATHKLYTACLDDTKPDERQLGMEMLYTLLSRTEYHAVYFDLGFSSGMKWGIEYATKHDKDIQYRSLYGRMYLSPQP